ncbi:hypothetical protein NC652_036520 [Populus alba x Populus x berolinensis]|nr:hypothetical protein NC652_036520 [Populus alba x Populus x berolinensis]
MLSSQELGNFVNLRVVLNITMASHKSIKFSFNLFGCELEKWTKRVQSLGYNYAFSSLQAKRPSKQNALRRLKALDYIKKQTQNPLYRIIFSRKMTEKTYLGVE